MPAVSQHSSGLTRAGGPVEDDPARARRRRWWALVVVVLLVAAALAGHAWWDWHLSAGDILPGEPIPA